MNTALRRLESWYVDFSFNSIIHSMEPCVQRSVHALCAGTHSFKVKVTIIHVDANQKLMYHFILATNSNSDPIDSTHGA